MRAVNRRTLALSLVLCACGSSSEQPLPSIVSVTPQSMAANEQILLTVDLEGTFPFKVDYASDSANLDNPARLSIADQPFDIFQSEEQGKRLLAKVGPGLPEGEHELRIDLSDGRQVTFAQHFLVTPGPGPDPDPDPDPEPTYDISLSIDQIPTQIRLRPFSIRVRAAGEDADIFRGSVTLSVSRGSITPTTCGPFSAGTCSVEITLDADSGADLTITAQDSGGHIATSNGFQLRPN